MPTKRSHTKSRFGCDRCRERRVKCDERLPQCSTCAGYDEICQYSRIRPGATLCTAGAETQSTRTSHGIKTCDSIISSINTPPQRTVWPSRTADDASITRLHELALMHHWTAVTCNSFPESVGGGLKAYIIREAFRYDYLMDTIFALTALHMASEIVGTPERAPYLQAALLYQNRALTGLRVALNDVSPSNCGSVFLSSTMVMMYETVSPFLQNGHDAEGCSTTGTILKLVQLVNGIMFVLSVSREWLSKGPVGCLLDMEVEMLMVPVDLPLDALFQLSNAQEDKETRCFVDHAIEALHWASRMGRNVIAWITAVKPAFLELIRTQNSLALSILMHWGVLLAHFRGLWWARFSGQRLVRDISETLDNKGSEWKDITNWCRVKVDSIRDDIRVDE